MRSELAAANSYGAAGTLTWEVWTLTGDDYNYECVIPPTHLPTLLQYQSPHLQHLLGPEASSCYPPPPFHPDSDLNPRGRV